MARIAGEAQVFALALQFLTRLPIPAAWTPARMAAVPRWLPAAGALIGAVAGAVYWLAALAFPPPLAAFLATAATVLLTGALHEDGFADVCDGLGGGATRARALEIMRDSRIGAYGAIGIGLLLAAKILALGSLPPHAVPLILVAGHAASRAAPVLVIAACAYAREDGAAAPVAGGVSPAGLVFALATAGLAVLATAFVLPAAALAGGLAGLLLGYAPLRIAFQRRLGGYTGDCLGAVQQTTECAFYLGVLACL